MRRLFSLLPFLMALVVLSPSALCQTWTPSVYDFSAANDSGLVASNGLFYSLSSDAGAGLYGYQAYPNAGYLLSVPEVNVTTLCFEGVDGNLYGVSNSQLVQISLAGVQNASFSTFPIGASCPVIASDGNYYGTSTTGGDYSVGYLYQITPSGTGTVLYDFSGTFDGSPNYSNSMVQGTDGMLYGFSSKGMFRFGATSGLQTFPLASGFNPASAPIEGPDGNFYTFETGDGTTTNSEVLKISPTGQMATLYTVPPADGNIQGLQMGGDGNLYVAQGSPFCGVSGLTALEPLSLTGTIGAPLWNFPSDYQAGSNLTFLTQASNGTYFVGLLNEEYDDGEGCETDDEPGLLVETPSTAPANVPISLTTNVTHVVTGGKVKLNWKVNNAYSATLKQCYGYGVLSGKVALSGTLTAALPAGTYTAAIMCGGTESAYVNVQAGSAEVGVGAQNNPVYPGDTAYISMGLGPITYTPAPTGSVSLYYGSTLLATQTISELGTNLAFSTQSIAPGSYVLTAKYPGDSNYGPATSSYTITLLPKDGTTLTPSPTSQTVIIGRQLSLVAYITQGSTTVYWPSPTGTITFSEGSTVLGSYSIGDIGYQSGATLSASTVGQAAGTYTVNIAYGGDQYHAPTSTTATVTLIQQSDSVTLTATPDPVPANTPVTLTATVTGNMGTPTGDVVFYADGVALAGATLSSSGTASVQIPASEFTAGTYQVQADYVGDSNNPAVNSAVLSLTVQ